MRYDTIPSMVDQPLIMHAGTPYRYSVYGITLVSGVRLSLPEAARDRDVVVELRVIQPESLRCLLRNEVRNSGHWFQREVLQNGTLYMRWQDLFEFLVASDGSYVLCCNLSNAELESFEAYLTNFAVSAALLQQGEEPIHATVVEIAGRVVGLLGHSGAGKSTLAAYLISRGGNLVTDDMLRLTFDSNTAVAHHGPHRLKLFEEPAQRYLQSAVCYGRFNRWTGKHLFQLGDPNQAPDPRPLSALFHLNWPRLDSTPNDISLARLTGLELFRTIASSTMNTDHNLVPRLQHQFRFAERLARSVPLYRLTYSRNYDVLNSVVDRIIETAQ
jgi:hypothetical protein